MMKRKRDKYGAPVSGAGDEVDVPEDETHKKEFQKHEIESSIPFSALSDIKLSFIERYLYYIIYVSFVGYSFYSLYWQTNAPDVIKQLEMEDVPVTRGFIWKYLDPANEKIIRLLEIAFPYMKMCVFYIVISRIARHVLPVEIYSIFCAFLSCSIGAYIFSFKSVICFLSTTTVALTFAHFRYHILNVILCIIGMFYTSTIYDNEILIDLRHEYSSILYPSISLTCCRLISLSDYISHNQSRTLLDYLAGYQFVLYPINFCYGSLINYSEFLPQLKTPAILHWKSFIVKAVKLCIYIVLYALVSETFHPHLYSMTAYNNMWSSIQTDRWGGAGMVGALALDFNLKYVHVYGWANLFASLDGIKLVEWPDCVLSTYLFSNIWRTFDRGLYNFIIRHIYIPMGGNKYGLAYKLFCSLVSFTIISIYHSGSKNILLWIGLNYFQVLVETVGCYLMWKSAFGKFLVSKISARNIRRISAFLGCLIYQISVIGISFFWQGYHSAMLFVTYMWRLEGLMSFLLVLNIGGYSFVNVAIDFQGLKREKRRNS